MNAASMPYYLAKGVHNMIAIHPEYVVDKRNHPKAVLVQMKDWRRIIKELEELDDIRAYDAAKAANADRLPFEQAVGEMAEKYEA